MQCISFPIKFDAGFWVRKYPSVLILLIRILSRMDINFSKWLFSIYGNDSTIFSRELLIVSCINSFPQQLSYPYIPGLNPTYLRCNIPLSCYWIVLLISYIGLLHWYLYIYKWEKSSFLFVWMCCVYRYCLTVVSLIYLLYFLKEILYFSVFWSSLTLEFSVLYTFGNDLWKSLGLVLCGVLCITFSDFSMVIYLL